MSKLELKQLAPYLPYGLKVTNGKEIAEITLRNADDLQFATDFKPILRPLSDLDNENVDGYVYSDWLIEKYQSSYVENQINSIKEDIRWINHCEYVIINDLIEWHFDVFNLIPQGLAIDINTLKD